MIFLRWLREKTFPGETVGYVVNVTSHEGYGGDIDISVGIREDGTVTGIRDAQYQ